jgi:hypothetical protein
MIPRSAIGVLTCAALFCTVSLAAAETPERDALVDELIQRSGVHEKIDQLPAIFISAIEQQRESIPPNAYDLMKQLIAQRVQPQRIEAEVVKALKSGFDDEATRTVLAWLRSPLGMQIAQIEIASETPEAMQEAREMAEGGEEEIPGPRSELIQRMLSSTGAVENNLEVLSAPSEKMLQGLNQRLPDEARIPDSILKAQIEARRTVARAVLEEELPKYYAHAYRTLTDDQLETYVRHLESQAGRWFSQRVNTAMVSSLSDMLEEVNVAFLEAVLSQANPPALSTH